MKLNELRPTKGSVHARKRVGRGYGSGRGGHESGRGNGGQNSRSGGGTRPGYEGGQTPIWMRFPKRGFRNYTRVDYACVNVDTLSEEFQVGEEVTLESVIQKRILKGRPRRLKILGRGEMEKALNVQAHRFTKEARRKIEQAGGKAEVV